MSNLKIFRHHNLIYFIILLSIFSFGCTKKIHSIEKNVSHLNTVYFDAVEKKIFFQDGTPKNFINKVNYWFENKVKVNGINGIVEISIFDYVETVAFLDNGKRIDISVNFEIKVLNKSNNIKKIKKINGQANSHGVITGAFSIKDFEDLIQSTQFDLIEVYSNEILLET